PPCPPKRARRKRELALPRPAQLAGEILERLPLVGNGAALARPLEQVQGALEGRHDADGLDRTDRDRLGLLDRGGGCTGKPVREHARRSEQERGTGREQRD